MKKTGSHSLSALIRLALAADPGTAPQSLRDHERGSAGREGPAPIGPQLIDQRLAVANLTPLIDIPPFTAMPVIAGGWGHRRHYFRHDPGAEKLILRFAGPASSAPALAEQRA